MRCQNLVDSALVIPRSLTLFRFPRLQQFFVIKDVEIKDGYQGTDIDSLDEHDIIYKCCWAGDAELDDPVFQFRRTPEGTFEVKDSWRKWDDEDVLRLKDPCAILRAGTIVDRKNQDQDVPGAKSMVKRTRNFSSNLSPKLRLRRRARRVKRTNRSKRCRNTARAHPSRCGGRASRSRECQRERD